MFRLLSEKNDSVLSYNVRIQNYDELGGMTSEDIINNTNLWMEPCLPNSSSWFRSLKKVTDVFNPLSIFNLMKQQNWSVASANKYEYSHNSMRTCPGITGLFKSTILLKAPMDIDIFVKDDGEKNLVINKSMFPKFLQIETHFKDQFSTGKDRFKDYRNLKFCYPFKVSSSHSYIFAQPYWHNEVPFDVPPGGFFNIYKKHADLNLNVFFKMNTTKEINEINIKKGTVLAYMIFPHPVSLKVDKKLEQNVVFSHLKNGGVS
tara:strand:- start:123 stop:905 length:783 start_codon:yes stop_codon:yes gene_type:complete